MVIREMSREECLRVLAGARLARLACAHENQPYVVPVYLAYHPSSGEECLYGFTTPGQKVEWMRSNPLVCVEVDEVAAYDQWVSVIVIGRYEELPEIPGSDDARGRAPERSERQVREAMPAWSADSPHPQCDDAGCDDERERAWQIIKTHPMWQEPGAAAWASRAHRDPAAPFISVFYRIRIDRVTGHEATRDAVSAPPAGRWDWLRGTLTRVFGGRSKVVEKLSNLRIRLEQHFCREDSGGYLDEAAAILPRLGVEVTEIKSQHPVLLSELDELLNKIRCANPTVEAWDQIDKGYQAFAKDILHHEAAENRILQMGYNEDFGLEP